MRIRLDLTAEYRFGRGELGPAGNFEARLAERELASGRALEGTFRSAISPRPITVYPYGDLMIYFEPVALDARILYLVVDTKHLPDWFESPAGTWFEHMPFEP